MNQTNNFTEALGKVWTEIVQNCTEKATYLQCVHQIDVAQHKVKTSRSRENILNLLNWYMRLYMAKKAFPLIVDVLDHVCIILEDKNKKYGDAARNPINIFSDLPAKEQIFVRLDDKIKRLRFQGNDDEDALLDLIGYTILYLSLDY